MKIGYARISTKDQSLDLQRDALTHAGCYHIFEDCDLPGTAKKRSDLDAALAQLNVGDVLVICNLDRLGRSLSHLIEVIQQLGERGIGFVSLSENIDTTTAAGKLVFQLVGALAEFERTLIVERVNLGIAVAKRRGKHVGRPRKLTPEQIAHAREAIDTGLQTPASMAAVLGVDHSTLWRALRKDISPQGYMATDRHPQGGRYGRL